MNKSFLKYALPVLMLISVPVLAEEDRGKNKQAGPVAELGIHVGGDDLVTVVFVGGDTQEVQAGGLISMAAGYRFDLSESSEAVFTFGYKFDSVSAVDGFGNDITFDFSRYVINGLYLIKNDKLHFGGGLTYHTMVEYSDNYQGGHNIDFDDAFGLLLEGRYFISDIGYFGLRYTSIEYSVSSSGEAVDGSSLGITLGAYF